MRTLQGQVYTIHPNPDASLEDFKQQIEEATGMNSVQQRIFFAGRYLEGDDKPLSSFGITHECNVFLVKKEKPQKSAYK